MLILGSPLIDMQNVAIAFRQISSHNFVAVTISQQLSGVQPLCVTGMSVAWLLIERGLEYFSHFSDIWHSQAL